VADLYREIKHTFMGSAFASEIAWQEQVSSDNIAESDFLRESAWVILSSGMREKVVRSKFPGISVAFFAWESASKIILNKDICLHKAMECFAHEGKIKAILEVARCVHQEGFPNVLASLRQDVIDYIQRFPYIGPTTSYHLAKNLGFDVVKPDRHLKRLAKCTGYATPADLCADIASVTCDRVCVVDLVLWRFATLVPNYMNYFTRAMQPRSPYGIDDVRSFFGEAILTSFRQRA